MNIFPVQEMDLTGFDYIVFRNTRILIPTVYTFVATNTVLEERKRGKGKGGGGGIV